METNENARNQLFNYLHRGGKWAYWWTFPEKQSTWWECGNPAPLPRSRNIYFSIHPTGQKGEINERSKNSTVTAINCLFAEFDKKDGATMELMEALDPVPSVIVASGGGWHCYWLFNKTVDINDSNRDEMRSLQSRWVEYFGGDPGSKDLARVLRVPGTNNGKYIPTRPVEFVLAEFDRLYSIDEFQRLLPPPAVVPQVENISPIGDSSADFWLQKYLAVAHIGNRNSAGADLALQLRDSCRLDESLAKAVGYPEMVPQAPTDIYSRDEWEKTVASIYAGAPREPAKSKKSRFPAKLIEPPPVQVHTEAGDQEGPPNFDDAAVIMPTEDEIIQMEENKDWIDPWGTPFTVEDAFQPRPPIEYLVHGLIKRPHLSMIYGAPGGLKTLLVQSLCLSVATGRPWFTESPWKAGGAIYPTQQVPSMLIDFDNGPNEMHERIEALARAINLEPAEIPFYYYSFPTAGFDAGNKLHIGELVKRIKQQHIGMVWFDNLGVIKGSASENSDEMIPIMNNFRYVVVETGCSLGIIHHQSKTKDFKRRTGESIRGHSSIEGSLDLALLVERDEYGDNILIKPTTTRGAMAYPFGAEFTYTWKEGTHDLDTAKFFSLPVEDKYSDHAVDDAIFSSLDEKKLNKTQLINAVKTNMPDMGVNRIRERIERLHGAGKLKETPGKRTERFYEIP